MVTLFDAHGRPMQAAPYSTTPGVSGWPLTTSDTGGRNIPPPRLDNDIALMVPRHRHRLLLADSRYIATTFELVSGALEQKRDYVSSAGYAPVFFGEDEVWGEIARAALLEAHTRSIVRSPFLDWDTAWKIGSTLYDIDADYFTHHFRDADGYPKIQFIEAHRVGSRYGETLVSKGPYSGRRILNGIIYDAVGTALAYRVLGTTPEQDQDIPASEIDHCCIPRWFSDGRPVPNITASILSWYDVKQAREYQRQKQQVAAALTMVEATEDGKMPDDAALAALMNARAGNGGNTPTTAEGAPLPPPVLKLDGGIIRYIKAGKGSISLFDGQTPGDSWMKFDESLQRGAFFGMGWRFEMLDLSKLSGAPTRGFQDQINTTIHNRWREHTRHVLRAELRLLSALIEIGRVPEHPEWMSWGYVPPAEFTVDGGRSNKADLDNVRAGIDSMPALIGRFGRTPTEVMTEQARYMRAKERLEKKFGLPPGALGTLAYPGWPAETFPAVEPERAAAQGKNEKLANPQPAQPAAA